MFKRRKANNIGSTWSSAEEDTLLQYLQNNTFSSTELLSIFPDRSLPAIRSKTRKLRIKNDLFGRSYRDEKKSFTDTYAAQLNCGTVFEAYCGAGHQTSVWAKYCEHVFASDKANGKKDQLASNLTLEGFESQKSDSNWHHFTNGQNNVYFFEGDAVDAAADLRANKIQIDILDLDTCGSTLPLLPLLLNLIKPKYLFITHGEFHSLRFGRDDVLRRVLFHRNINDSCAEFTNSDLARELDLAVKVGALRCNNETKDSFWAELIDEKWLGSVNSGMLRRFYKITKPPATADCLNHLLV